MTMSLVMTVIFNKSTNLYRIFLCFIIIMIILDVIVFSNIVVMWLSLFTWKNSTEFIILKLFLWSNSFRSYNGFQWHCFSNYIWYYCQFYIYRHATVICQSYRIISLWEIWVLKDLLDIKLLCCRYYNFTTGS